MASGQNATPVGNGKHAVKRAVFLDRDGTINEEKDYLYQIDDCQFIPNAAEAIRRLNTAGFLVIVVTNQSGIGRGFYTEEMLAALHRHMEQTLTTAGAKVDGWYFCPHHPHHGIGSYRKKCSCRKPLPGMLRAAASDFSINLEASFLVGDKLADIEAGLSAGCRPLLVRTGYGLTEEKALPPGVLAYDDILAASQAIIGSLNAEGGL